MRGDIARLGDDDESRGLPRLEGEPGLGGGLRGLFDFFGGFLTDGYGDVLLRRLEGGVGERRLCECRECRLSSISGDLALSFSIREERCGEGESGRPDLLLSVLLSLSRLEGAGRS